MNPLDPSMADGAVVKVMATVVAVVLACLGVWYRFWKTRGSVGIIEGDHARFQDAIEDARAARKEVHEVRNEMMAMQHKLGRLEAENEACNKRADRQDIEIAALKEQNKGQAGQISALMRDASKIRPLTGTDFGAGK